MQTALPQRRIINYSLFGETADPPDPVHCETIEARAPRHGRRLSSHRHPRMHQVVVLASGHGRTRLDGRDLDLNAPCLVNVPAGAVHGFDFSGDAAGWVVTLDDALLQRGLPEQDSLMLQLSCAEVLDAHASLLLLARAIHDEFLADAYGRQAIMRAQAGLFLCLVARAMPRARRRTRDVSGERHLRRFADLIERKWRQHLPIAEYAASIGITVHHLGRLTRAASGLTPSQWLLERVVREARQHLAYTDLPITMVAERLGYADPAHFSRIFSRATGSSPRAYRKALQEKI